MLARLNVGSRWNCGPSPSALSVISWDKFRALPLPVVHMIIINGYSNNASTCRYYYHLGKPRSLVSWSQAKVSLEADLNMIYQLAPSSELRRNCGIPGMLHLLRSEVVVLRLLSDLMLELWVRDGQVYHMTDMRILIVTMWQNSRIRWWG